MHIGFIVEENMQNNVELMVKILDKKQAEDIRVIDIEEISTIADFFVIANAKNLQHLNALVDEIVDELEKEGMHEKKIEGNYTSGWVLIDFGEIILHIFDRENRLFYNLEKMWKDGKEVNIDSLIGRNNEGQN